MLCVQLADVFMCVRNLVEDVCIIVIVIIAIVVIFISIVVVIVSSHSVFLPGIFTFVLKVIPTALSS